jgi:uncharacterized protein (DUF2141 family)
MEIIDTELTAREIADRLRAKQGKVWAYTSTHGKTCMMCEEAVIQAKAVAVEHDSVCTTYTLHYQGEVHIGTAIREA